MIQLVDQFAQTPEWYSRSSCHASPELTRRFYVHEDVVVMRHICRDCPVSTECLMHGFAHQEQGTWGGVDLDDYFVPILKKRAKPLRERRYAPNLMRPNAVGTVVYGCPSCHAYETVVPDRRTYFCAFCSKHFRP